MEKKKQPNNKKQNQPTRRFEDVKIQLWGVQ